jgi:hypothetical protein
VLQKQECGQALNKLLLFAYWNGAWHAQE